VQEAGGVITGLGKSVPMKGDFVAANTSLAPKLVEVIEGKLKKPAPGHPKLRPL